MAKQNSKQTKATKTNAALHAKTKAAVRAKAKAAPAKAEEAKAKVRTITILKKDFTFGREGTVRRASWDALTSIKGTKTDAAYKANGGKTKYLRRWAAAGVIQIAA